MGDMVRLCRKIHTDHNHEVSLSLRKLAILPNYSLKKRQGRWPGWLGRQTTLGLKNYL